MSGAVAELRSAPPLWHLGPAVRLVAIFLLLGLMKSRSADLAQPRSSSVIYHVASRPDAAREIRRRSAASSRDPVHR